MEKPKPALAPLGITAIAETLQISQNQGCRIFYFSSPALPDQASLCQTSPRLAPPAFPGHTSLRYATTFLACTSKPDLTSPNRAAPANPNLVSPCRALPSLHFLAKSCLSSPYQPAPHHALPALPNLVWPCRTLPYLAKPALPYRARSDLTVPRRAVPDLACTSRPCLTDPEPARSRRALPANPRHT